MSSSEAAAHRNPADDATAGRKDGESERMAPRRATLRDVAREAGVSVKTASRVVNLDPAVAESTRTRVLDAIEAVYYVPNAAARLLRAGAGDTIGLIIDSIADPWFAALTSVVEEQALARGMSVIIGSSGRDPMRLRSHVQRLVQLRCRGIILAPLGAEETYLPHVLRDLPLVCVDRASNGGDYDLVRSPDREAARHGVQHLVDHGHRRIAFLGGGERLPTVILRQDGYCDALRDNGIAVDPALIRGDSEEADTAFNSALELLHEVPDVTAIFAANARCGIGLTQALHAARRTDVAMISFGDFSLAAVVEPAVTVLDQNPRPIGAKVAELLFARISGDAGPTLDVALPTRLIQRGSGELQPWNATAG